MSVPSTRPDLRPAHPDDLQTIAEIWHAGWSDGHEGNVPDELKRHRTFDDFHRLASERLEDTTVAVAGTLIVGFVTVRTDEVEQIYVDRGARGTGIADLLLQHAESAIGRGHDVAWLAVVAGNQRARRFYARSGWHDAGPLDYAAETASGTFTVPARRYEKQVR